MGFSPRFEHFLQKKSDRQSTDLPSRIPIQVRTGRNQVSDGVSRRGAPDVSSVANASLHRTPQAAHGLFLSTQLRTKETPRRTRTASPVSFEVAAERRLSKGSCTSRRSDMHFIDTIVPTSPAEVVGARQVHKSESPRHALHAAARRDLRGAAAAVHPRANLARDGTERHCDNARLAVGRRRY